MDASIFASNKAFFPASAIKLFRERSGKTPNFVFPIPIMDTPRINELLFNYNADETSAARNAGGTPALHKACAPLQQTDLCCVYLLLESRDFLLKNFLVFFLRLFEN